MLAPCGFPPCTGSGAKFAWPQDWDFGFDPPCDFDGVEGSMAISQLALAQLGVRCSAGIRVAMRNREDWDSTQDRVPGRTRLANFTACDKD